MSLPGWLQTVLMAAAVASPVDDPNWTFCPRQHAVAWRRHQDRRPARGSSREGDGMKRIVLDVLLLVIDHNDRRGRGVLTRP
jgi:hypothetical protein